VIGGDNLSQVLGIEPRGQRRRGHEIHEHHSELPALGLGRWRSWPMSGQPLGIPGVASGGRRAVAQRRDRVEQLAAVADGDDPHLLEVITRELDQDLGVDTVVALSTM
jgi:hypothetical protein